MNFAVKKALNGGRKPCSKSIGFFVRLTCQPNRRKLRYALAFARANQAKLILLYCRKPSSFVDWSTSANAAWLFQQALFTHLDADELKALDWEPAIAEGDDVGRTIIEEASKRRADLIVMRSRRRPHAAALLRHALNNGYEEGFLAGQADREDGWRFDYEGCYAYQDANYGYGGYYIDQSEYNYYFREGFRRGYEDGYYGRYRYGSKVNGVLRLLDGVLLTVLRFESLD